MRTFLDIDHIKTNILAMKELAKDIYSIQYKDDNSIASRLANVIDYWSPPETGSPYYGSDRKGHAFDCDNMFLFHMRRGTSYRIVVKIGDGLVPIVDISKWSDLLIPQIKLMFKSLAIASNDDIMINLINWSPIEEPRIAFDLLVSFIDTIGVVDIIGVKLVSSQYKTLIPKIEYYASLLTSLDF